MLGVLVFTERHHGHMAKSHAFLGAVSIRKTVLLGMVIPMLKIRRPTGRLIFNMGIPIPGKTVFYIETGPWLWSWEKTEMVKSFQIQTQSK